MKRFGSLLLDPRAVMAIVPLSVEDGKAAYGLRLVTTGGPLDITDAESAVAIWQYFTENELTSNEV